MRNPHLILESLINRDTPDKAFPLVDDDRLLAVVNAWRSITVEWDPPVDLEEIPLTDNKLWDLLWSFSVWDLDDLSYVSGLTETVTLNCFNRARSFRLIYPDGNISTSSRRFLNLTVGAALGVMAQDAGAAVSSDKAKKSKKSKGSEREGFEA